MALAPHGSLTLVIKQLTILRSAMVTRLFALWLAVLTALPFTAPFATFHLSDFVNGRARNVIDTVAAPATSGAHDDDADDVAASGGYFQPIHPMGLCGRALLAFPVARD